MKGPALLLLFTTLASLALAEDKPTLPAFASPKEFASFAEKHCLDCHSTEVHKGGFDLEDLLKQPNINKSPAAWHGVLEVMVSREMPPKKKKERPSEDEYHKGEEWIRAQLTAYENFAATQRPRPMRRLNRDEYNRTIQAVFGLPANFRPADAFPPDEAVEGFTNNAEGLTLSRVLVEQYLAAGTEVAKLALSEGAKPESKKYICTNGNKDYGLTLRGHDPGGAILQGKWIGDHLFIERSFPAGIYKVALVGMPKNLDLRPGYTPNFQFRANQMLVHTGDEPLKEGVQMRHEFMLAHAKGGSLNLDFRWTNGFPQNNDLRAAGIPLPEWNKNQGFARTRPWNYYEYVWKTGNKKPETFLANVVWEQKKKENPDLFYPFPYFEDFQLEIEGPLFPEGWPLSRFQRENEKALVEKNSKALGEWLLPQLYRRPVKGEEVEAFAATVANAEKQLSEANPPVPQDKRYPEAVRQALQQALVSPNFIFMVEPGPVGRPLSDHELAVRLSYFIWGSAPDAELAKLADSGQLRPALAAQAKRLMADSRSSGFLDRFTSEWLGLAKLSTIMPEPALYPRFDKQGLLNQDMATEPRAVLGYILKENRSLYELLDADYTFINDRMADHYHLPSLWSMFPLTREGFAPVSGGEFRKVTMPDRQRGGLVTMAAVHAMTSENTRTSPVRRGVWVLEKLFNRTPPPPPPNVNGVLPDTAEGVTVTEKLKLHRNAPNCAGCHQRIDPYGVALENFDVIGEWRDREPPHIDPANPANTVAAVRARLKLKGDGPLPDFPIDNTFTMGTFEGQGVTALKQYLMTNKDKFARGFTEKLTAYALGRKHLITDEPDLDKIRAKANQENFGFQSLIVSLVESPLFLKH